MRLGDRTAMLTKDGAVRWVMFGDASMASLVD
jgi:hypothetical protein